MKYKQVLLDEQKNWRFDSNETWTLFLTLLLWGPLRLPLMGIFNQILYNKLIVQSTIKNPHKNQTMVFNISYHNFYGLGI